MARWRTPSAAPAPATAPVADRPSVALVGALGLVAGWLLASVVSPPVASLQSVPPPVTPPAPLPIPELPPYAERLQLKLRQAPSAPVPRRNPFSFGGDRIARATRFEATRLDAPPAPVASSPSLAPEPTAPRLVLSGIATSAGDDGPRFRAIVSAFGDVWIVGVGDAVGAQFQVVGVDESTATLADAAGQPITLRLK